MKQLYSLGVLLLCLQWSYSAKAQIKYAARVTAWSSQYYASGSWTAQQAAGLPNVAGCGDYGNAWASKTQDDQREWLEFEFDDPAPISRVFIHETYNAGAVDTVYVFNPNTQLFEKVYEGSAAAGAPCPRAFSVAFPATVFPVSRIRIAINSPAVRGYNEIDAVGVALYSDGGAIGSSQDVCASAAAALLTNAESAFGGNAAAAYQWQDSAENGSWKNISGAVSVTYQPTVITETTWYRRTAALGGVKEYSNVIKLNFLESGDPSFFPSNAWNFYTYQSKVIDLGTSVYKGFYSRPVLNFNTRNDWAMSGSPSVANAYQGCVVNNNDFVLAARRKGFPAGNYVLHVLDFRGTIRAYVNGAALPAISCCAGTISLGALDNDSEVEIRLLDVSSDAFMNLEFRTGVLNGGDIGEHQSLCLNDAPAAFVNNIAAFGGAAPSSITYQWQDSVVNGVWTNIPAATAAIYQAAALPQTTWFRRKASDNTGAIAYSDIVKVNIAAVQGDTAVYGNQSWNIYAFNGNDIHLTTNQYRGYYTATGLSIITTNHWSYWESPSSAVNYVGCPVGFENFLMSARRQGFPAGNYTLNLSNVDDQVMVIVNGVVLHTGGAANLVLGLLDAQSTVELRLKEGTYTSRMSAEFIRVDYSISEYVNTSCRSYSLNNVKGNEWFDITDGSGKLIASIHPNGNDLGTVSLNAKHFGTGGAAIPTNAINKKKYMPRYFNFSSSLYPSSNFPSPVKIRLYYKNSELEDYKTAVSKPALTRAELGIAHYNGSREDCEMGNNTSGGDLLPIPATADFTSMGFYLETVTNSFSEFGTLEGSPALPVKFTQFQAIVVNKEVQLRWTTAQELNNKGFEVSRSTDGKSFMKTGWVDGNGTTYTTQQYVFTDASPLAGKNFYRLRQVDIDGNDEYSDIVAVSMSKTLALRLLPNPVQDILYVEYDHRNTVGLRILDLQGIVQWRNDGMRPSSVIAVPVQQLAKGIYLLELTDKNGQRQSKRFIKQ
ncbi:T9SS type A sorting domain-containing protein [Pseudobacter ginsenosidimutans]|uniref:Putative secreted protein (Por secretion system target) n=1 Tax=Pseudobacter ginsenosidimutans TaxID=661488 RepID=A0A4Q7MAE4_9BACT|nr:T9SS type A sorting domain-containing protein [Pseudobacter ginsenosidimutans]QEC42693.1 T9SS type A sorting domain-containing protein [Pseudobacter ginsenosidimutans]RZS65155.1 putative secreted protein (Por secretion system target) [Pseudobacter ginsenosidimutans]